MNGWDAQSASLIVLFTVIGVACNQVLQRTSLGSLPDIDGCPFWSWVFGAIMQGTVYPGMLYLAYHEQDGDLLTWMHRTWADPGNLWWERVWLCVFAGYLLKDMTVMDDTLFFVHHVACFVGVLMTLFSPEGVVPLVLGMCSLEVGSCVFSLAKIMPAEPHTDIRWDRLYWVGMTISNALCLVACSYNALVAMNDTGLSYHYHLGFKAFLCLTTVILVGIRQQIIFASMSSSTQRYADHKAKVGVKPNGGLSDATAQGLTWLAGGAWIGGVVYAVSTSYQRQVSAQQ